MKALGDAGGDRMPKTADNRQVQSLMSDENAQLVEVLPEDDFEHEHIAGAINVPLKRFRPDDLARLDRSRPVIVYCNDFL